jgi:hypothetical protein
MQHSRTRILHVASGTRSKKHKSHMQHSRTRILHVASGTRSRKATLLAPADTVPERQPGEGF